MASIAVGVTVSAVRWALLDTVHSLTGLRLPPLDFSRLGKNVQAFELLIEIHYKHYLCYGNELVATVIAYTCYRVKLGGMLPLGRLDLAFVVLEFIFFIASRDTLHRYYTRSQQLLATDARSRQPSPVVQRRSHVPKDEDPAPGS